MRVCELVEALQALPDQDATVVIGEGGSPGVWLIVSGLISQKIARMDADHAVPGSEPAIEIV